MFDPTTGSVTINEIDLRDMELESLRSQISYVPQDVFLFSDTIQHNINFGSTDNSLEKARVAAEKAVILAEIESLPQGFQTWIGERGVTFIRGTKTENLHCQGFV
jgi:ATP-binding cassette, subfamily B, multidrug efflux pump